MSSYRPVDPLTGKPMGMGTYTPSAGLQQRLREQRQSRTTPDGMFQHGQHGLEFIPKSRTALHDIAEPGAGDKGTSCRGEFASAVDAIAQGLQEAYSVLGMTQAELEQVMAAPTFDPMTERLNVGDLVEVVCEESDYWGIKDRIRKIMVHGTVVLANDTAWNYRSSLKLLEKGPGFDPFTEKLNPDDWVQIVGGLYDGKSGYVRHIKPETGNPVVWFAGGGMGMPDRANTKLVTKAPR